uniref:Uncharacterized protein n=1 Tax=Timema monikensis TaxID=170555 RepID=A0A7R9HSV2_9NEOP|nr:unnamed protein product [Timema monikensis]
MLQFSDVWLVCEPESAGATQLHRMQQLMLALFPFFVVSQTLFQELSGAQEGGDAHNSEVVKSVLWFFRIACNLVLFARNIVASQGVDHRATRVIFKPTLGESRTVERRFRGEFHNSGSSEPPNLGVVVKQLVQCVDHHIREKASLEFLCRKLAFLPSMNATEMKEFLPEATTKTYTLVETCALAEQQLESRIINKKQELQHCMYLIENCLYLLWSHLDYYMLRAIPRTKFGLSYAKSVSEGYATPLTESAWKVTMEDISALKQGLVTMFNDSFSKKLLDIAQGEPPLVPLTHPHPTKKILDPPLKKGSQ